MCDVVLTWQTRQNEIKTHHNFESKYIPKKIRLTKTNCSFCLGGKQPAVEEALEIGGFGYPAMAAVNYKKLKYTSLRGSFSKDGIYEFLRDISYGRGQTAPVRGAAIPKIDTVEAWDGKDGQLPEEEELDLSDVVLDDKDEL